MSDAADAVGSAVGAVGDAVEGAANLISDGLHGLEDGFDWVAGQLGAANSWLCEHAGSIGCRIGNIILGGIAGSLGGIGDLIGGLGDLVEHVGGFLGALLRLDFADAIAQLGLIIGDLVLLGLGMLRLISLGSFIGGIVDSWQAEDLRQFVQQLLTDTFGNNPPRLARIIEHVGLHNADWGLPLTATHRVFMLDSAHVPLWQWHQNGDLDLYAMAGWLSFDSFSIGRRRTEVRLLNSEGTIYSSIPATRWSISKYLESQGRDVRLQVFALTNRAITDMTQVATKKLARMRVKLSWNVDGLGRFDVPPTHEIATKDEFNINQEAFGSYLIDHGYRQGTYEEQCEALAFTAFFMQAKLGNTVGRDISDNANVQPCQPGRNDHCCNKVQLTIGGFGGRPVGSGCIYHDQYPPFVFRYALAHELGHYVGLCHYGHDGFQNIMFTPNPQVGLSYTSWGLFRYYLHNEPEFTLDDAKNTWRFLVQEMSHCLDPAGDPPPVIL